MTNLAIIGGGSWGTALAIVLAPRWQRVHLWVYEEDLAQRMQSVRENDIYLPGLALPANVEATSCLAACLEGCNLVLGVMPSHLARGVYARMAPSLTPDMLFVSATKGLENGTLRRVSQIIGEVMISRFQPRVGVLSGPTFAREVAGGSPTALVVASEDEELARIVQCALSGPTFRVYSSSDPVGVEIGGSIKNVVAIAAGVCTGLGLGHNTIAALITRGLAEMTRLAAAMGGRASTLAGLAGLGDLVLTCTGELSRNRSVGIELAKGRATDQITSSMRMVAEGIKTAQAAVELAELYGVDMPIARETYAILAGTRSPSDAITRLMHRTLKQE